LATTPKGGEAVVSVVDGERDYREDFDKVEWSSNNIVKPPVSKIHSAHGEWLVSVVYVELDYREDFGEGGVENHKEREYSRKHRPLHPGGGVRA